MTQMDVGRLTLKLDGFAGYGTQEGERLARKVADRLAEATLARAGGGMSGNLSVQMAARPSSNMDQLAEQVVSAILREVERTI
jgi:hypothetical protein